MVAAWSVDRLVLMIDLRRRPLIETRVRDLGVKTFVASRHGENISRGINVFLEKYYFSLAVFEDMSPLVLHGLPGFLSPTRQRAQDHDRVSLLNHFTRCEFTKLYILGYASEKSCNLLLAL